MTAQSAPPLLIGGPSSAAWRQEAIARAHGLSFLTEWAREGPELISADSVSAIHEHVRAAQEAADGSDSGPLLRTWRRVNGSSFERALANLDTAEVDLLRLVSQPTLQGAFPSIQSHVNRFLAKDDPRRMAVDAGKQAEQMLIAAGAKRVQLIPARALPGTSIHEMGGARMGNNPADSVLNAHNQVHGVRNLFVTDGSAMASSGTVNPSLTYMALTVRAVDYAVAQLKAGQI